jgi:cytidine deaminase
VKVAGARGGMESSRTPGAATTARPEPGRASGAGRAVDPSGAPKGRREEPGQGASRSLLQAARAAAERAYAPYSGLNIGAAVRTVRGGVYTGCNVENASYGLTSCAERNAIFAAVAAEGPAMRIAALAIHANARSAPPCGACRQVIREFGPDAKVIFPLDGEPRTITVPELLPLPFRLS